MSNVLELKHIIKNYPDGQQINEVLKDVSFQVKQGEFAAIVGPSGAGKSTLLTIMGALLTPSSGTISLNGQDISHLSQAKQTKLRLNQIGFIFQNADLIPYLKISDQLKFIQKISSKEPSDANALLKSLGLEQRLDSYPNVLSGGEKQRVAIARAFINWICLMSLVIPVINLIRTATVSV